LIVAGAGTGKTRTLVHRVAHLIDRGVQPGRILLLTFTRRAAAEMLARVDSLSRQLAAGGGRAARAKAGKQVWGGTFHAVATRLLRIHGAAIGLDPSFTIHDRADSEDLLDVVRTDLRLSRTDKRFPKKGTCLAIYSHCVSSRRPLDKVLLGDYPWCADYTDDLKRLFWSMNIRTPTACKVKSCGCCARTAAA
jgi:DNA helicase II / ATP-dependent DNA helicase PcrA